MTTNHDNHIPPDLAPIAAAVDDLALRERRSAAPTLEDRVFVATRAGLAGQAPGAPIPIVMRRSNPWFSRVKLAAAVALGAGGLAIWMAQLNQPGPSKSAGLAAAPAHSIDLARLEADVELLLTIRTFADGFDEIDDLYLDTEEVRSSLRDDWLQTVLDEGVM
jgi:hypothetical protein